MIYLKDGNIPLNLAYDDDIVQEANSTYQLSFKFPLTDGKWNLLRREVFLLADDLHGEQEFFIFEVKKAKGHVQVYAKQVATLLNYYSINSISVDRVPGQTVMTALAGSVKRPCPFTFFSDILDRHTFNESNVSVMAALAKDKHSIVGQWGGDLVRDKYQVKLLKNGGIENESLFMYKKNLSSYEESENINNLKTRLHLKKTIKGQSEGEADRVIAVTVDSPLIGQYRQIYEADIEVNDQDVTDVASLTAYGKRYFSSTLCDLVENSINLDVKGKSDVSVKMFDMVSIFHERFDVDLRLKISSYHFGPMSKRLKSIGFGKVSQSFGSTVASMVAGSVDKATGRLSASFEQKLQKEIDNANRHFDAEFDKRVESINDGIEQAQAEAERYADAIKQEIDTEIAQVNQSMQSQEQEHDREVANILSKTQSVESLANQAKADAANAIARANQVKTEAIADARAQVATVNQALNTAKTELQSAIASADQKARDSQASATALRNDLNLQASKILAQAQAQTALTNRVSTVESLADGTRSIVAELSKTVNKATGDIASVTSRTKTVEDTLSQTRTQYEALTQTVNTQTGQIESINRRTADLQSGIDGVTERFENLRVGGRNLIPGTAAFSGTHWEKSGTWRLEESLYKGAGILTWVGGMKGSPIANISVQSGDTYTFSAYIKKENAGTVYFYLYDEHETWFAAANVPRETLIRDVGNNFQRFTITFKVTRSGILKPRFAIIASDTGGFSVAGYQLETGTVATDWTPAPEDIHSEIAIYKRTAEESSAELSRQIQLADGKAVEAKSYAQQTTDAIKTRLESLETYKNGESTRASQYFTASRDETARQITAERTAIANNYVAKAKYEEDARGVTQRFESLQVGATNYIRDFGFANLGRLFTNTSDWKFERVVDAMAKSGHHLKATCTGAGTGGMVADFFDLRGADWQGKMMTFAVDIKCSKPVRLKYGCEAFEDASSQLIDVTTGWKRYASSRKVQFNRWHNFAFYLQAGRWEVGDVLYIRDPQLEDGNIATTPHAAEEDLRSEIATYKRTAEESSTELSRQIQLADGKAVEAKSYAQQTTDAIKTRLESLETYKNGESTRASQYFTASRDETARQITAERTAIANNYVAKSIYDENVRGTTLKLNEIKTTADTAKQNLATYRNTVDRKLEELTSSTQTIDRKINTASTKVDMVAGEIRTELSQVESKIPTEMSGNLILEGNRPWSSTSYLAKEYQLAEPLEEGKTYTFVIHWWRGSGASANYVPMVYYNSSTLQLISPNGTTALQESASRLRYDPNIDSWVATFTVKKRSQMTVEQLQVFDNRPPKLLVYRFGSNVKDQNGGWADTTQSNASFATLVKGNIPLSRWEPAYSELATVTALHNVTDTVKSHTRTIGAVGETGSILDNVSKVAQTAAGLVQEVSGTNGLKTQVGQLKNSWAVKISGPEGLKTAINASEDGIRFKGKNLWLDGNTLIDNAVITSAMIAGLDAGKITTGYLDAARIRVGAIDGSKIAFDEAFFNGLTANQAYLKKLFAKDAFITSVQAVAVSAKQIAGGIAKALNGGMDVNFDESKINFYTNVAAIRRIYTGHPTQFIKFETEGNYSRTIIGSNRNGGEVFNSATFAGVVVENTNNINTEDNVRIYGDSTLLRHAQGDVGWNINSVTQRIVPANMNAESEIWSKHFVAPDKNSKPVRLDTAVAALWDIWNHIIYNNFEFNEALRTHIKARRDNWKFELNL
ncbi:gp58-like family protein [Streptococcus suis]|nr:gp58-like family protein [Streptococcus suis]MDG3258027.1 gp58-like family protein [Streptococcus suis]